jgi:hypothetical protein
MPIEEERNRDKLIYDIIVDRFELEWKRTNDIDSKASSVTGFAGLLATLTAGISGLLPQAHYNFLFLIPLGIFILSAFFGLLALWLRNYGGIRPDVFLKEYTNKEETEVLRRYVATISMLTMYNYEYNADKTKWLNIAFSLLILGIGLFFGIAVVNMLV